MWAAIGWMILGVLIYEGLIKAGIEIWGIAKQLKGAKIIQIEIDD